MYRRIHSSQLNFLLHRVALIIFKPNLSSWPSNWSIFDSLTHCLFPIHCPLGSGHFSHCMFTNVCPNYRVPGNLFLFPHTSRATNIFSSSTTSSMKSYPVSSAAPNTTFPRSSSQFFFGIESRAKWPTSQHYCGVN